MIYPELIKGEPWKVVRTKASDKVNVDTDKKILVIGDNATKEEAVYALARVVANYNDTDKTHDTYDEAVLLASIGLWLEQSCGINIDREAIDLASLDTSLKIVFGLCMVSTRNKGLIFVDDDPTHEKINSLLSYSFDILSPGSFGGRLATQARRDELASILREEFPNEDAKRKVFFAVPATDGQESSTGEGQQIDADDIDSLASISKTASACPLAPVDEKELDEKDVKKDYRDITYQKIDGEFPYPVIEGEGNFGNAVVIEAPMVSINSNSYAKKLAKKKAFFDTGSIPLRFDRWASQTIFSSRGKSSYGLGGTILVDWSGSMSLSVSDVIKVILAAPFSTIAVYSGGTRIAADGKFIHGRVVVVARNKRIADLTQTGHGQSNEIDGPAIEWLSTQRGPRFYVGDLQFTGVGDGLMARNTAPYKKAISTLIKSEAIHVPNPDALVQVITSHSNLQAMIDKSRAFLEQRI